MLGFCGAEQVSVSEFSMVSFFVKEATIVESKHSPNSRILRIVSQADIHRLWIPPREDTTYIHRLVRDINGKLVEMGDPNKYIGSYPSINSAIKDKFPGLFDVMTQDEIDGTVFEGT